MLPAELQHPPESGRGGVWTRVLKSMELRKKPGP